MSKPYKELEAAQTFIRAVNNKTRARIIDFLTDNGERTVTQITNFLNDIDQPATSSHLGILKRAGVVISRKDGKHRLYSITQRFIEDFYYLSSFDDPIVSPMDQIDF